MFFGEMGSIYPPDIPENIPGRLGTNFMGFLMFQGTKRVENVFQGG